MDFDIIKDHYLEKFKKQKPNYYVIEKEDQDEMRYLVEQKIMEIMLADAWRLEELIRYDFVKKGEWHVENDIVYIPLKLNDEGNDLYNTIVKNQKQAKKDTSRLLKAVDLINSGRSSNNLKDEMHEVEFYCKTNNIKKIYKRECKDMEKEEEKSLSR